MKETKNDRKLAQRYQCISAAIISCDINKLLESKLNNVDDNKHVAIVQCVWIYSMQKPMINSFLSNEEKSEEELC